MFYSIHKTTIYWSHAGVVPGIVSFMRTMEELKPGFNEYDIEVRLDSYTTKTYKFRFCEEETEDGWRICDSLRDGEKIITSWDGEIPWNRIESRLWEILVEDRP